MDESFELEQPWAAVGENGNVVSKNVRGSHIVSRVVNLLRKLLSKENLLRLGRKMRKDRPQGVCEAKEMCRRQPIEALRTLFAPSRNGHNFFESFKLMGVDWKKERAIDIFSRALLEDTSLPDVRDLEKLMESLKKNLEMNFEEHPFLKEDGFSIRNHPTTSGKILQLNEKYVP